MTNSSNHDFYWLELDLGVACRRSKLPRRKFLTAAGLSESEFEHGNDKLLSRKIWETAEALTGRPEVGLDVIDELKLDDFGDLGLLVITSDDFRAAIQNLEALSGTTSRQWKYRFVDHPEFPSIVLEETSPEYPYSHHCVDSTIAVGIFLARSLLGKSNYDVYRVNFRHPDFDVGRIYEERLGCRCRFNQKADSVEFAADSLCHPMPLRNRELNDALQARLKLTLSQEEDFKSRVTQAVYELIKQRLWPSRQRVARLLELGERTMLRRLSALDTTYRELQEAVLEREARRMLAAGTSAEKIAEYLGYASSAPLARMLKRRTGLKLSELRKR